MRIKVRGHHIELTDRLHQKIERRLGFALDRFQGRIRKVSVEVNDFNGPRGGIDKKCQIVVDLIPSGCIVVTGTAKGLYEAVDWVSDRTGHAVSRELARRGEIKRNGASSMVAGLPGRAR